MTHCYVGSEVGVLHRVMLHRPDLELRRLTPSNCEDLLFDDVLWVRRARQEHDAFADALVERGVEVLYLADLLAETVKIDVARACSIMSCGRTITARRSRRCCGAISTHWIRRRWRAS